MGNIENKPGFWGVLPAPVRYAEGLRFSARVIYSEITALANKEGYCWASNEYFAELFQLTAKSISEIIGTLAKRGFVRVEVLRNESNEVLERRIWNLVPLTGESPPPPPKNRDTPSPEKTGEGIPENQGTPPPKNREKNNINSLNNITPLPPKGGRRPKEPLKAPNWKPERFNGFWAFYPRGEAKQAAIRAWDNLKPSDALIDTMALTLKRQMATEEWTRGVGIPYASTWINGRRWEDVQKELMPQTRPASGGVRVIETERVANWDER